MRGRRPPSAPCVGIQDRATILTAASSMDPAWMGLSVSTASWRSCAPASTAKETSIPAAASVSMLGTAACMPPMALCSRQAAIVASRRDGGTGSRLTSTWDPSSPTMPTPATRVMSMVRVLTTPSRSSKTSTPLRPSSIQLPAMLPPASRMTSTRRPGFASRRACASLIILRTSTSRIRIWW